MLAALLGAASPICMYGTIPLIASLGRKGLPEYILAAFMITSILINPNLLVFSFVLGAYVAIIRLLCCLGAGIAAGLLVRVFFKNKNLFNFEGFEDKTRSRKSPTLKVFLSDLHRGFVKTAPYFLIGIIITALFDRLVPKELVIDLFGKHKGFGVLMASTLGVPVYVCGGGTIPLLKAWLDNGMSLGAGVAFMITGPATKLTNVSAVKIILGFRNFILYIAFNMVFAVLIGLSIDAIINLL
jgi:uncharacterized membrane protein YraQ (UPF0718 family)